MTKKKYLVILLAVLVSAGAGTLFYLNHEGEKRQAPPKAVEKQIITKARVTETNKVSMKDKKFLPESLSVKKGTSVTWTNDDNIEHTVTIDVGDGPKSEKIKPSQTYSYKFEEKGAYGYHSLAEPKMHGFIIVSD